jgi:putative transposase
MAKPMAALGDLQREGEFRRKLWPLIEQGVRSRSIMERLAAELGVSVATLYRKRRGLEESGGLASAIEPKRPGVKPKSRFLRSDLEEIIGLVIEKEYLTDQKLHVMEVVKRVHDHCAERKIARSRWPSRTAIQARLDAVEKFVAVSRREGRNASRALRPMPGEFICSHPNEYWFIDHTPADILLVDEVFRLYLGRPTLTLIIDAFTRMCVGFFVSFGKPSRVQVAMAMLHALFPKDAWLEERGIRGEVIAYGIPKIIHSDNAKEFHSLAFRRGCAELGIINEYRLEGEPQHGALIERYIGSTLGDVHLLPGTTFSNIQDRGDYESERKAVMTLAAFERWLGLNIIKYHASGHRGIDNFSPQSKWLAALEEGWRPQTVGPGQARHIMLSFLPSERRRVQRTGIHFRRLCYWADWLGGAIQAGGAQIEIKYDPRDMSSIWAQARSGAWERVALKRRQEPFTLAEHVAALRHLDQTSRASHDEETIHRVRTEQRELVEQEYKATLKARRASTYRRHAIEDSARSLQISAPPADDARWMSSRQDTQHVDAPGLSESELDMGGVEEW